MATVNDILQDKGTTVYSIHPDATVYEAISWMVEHRVGSLVVMNGPEPCGILTERDYLEKVALRGRTSTTTAVRDIMSKLTETVTPDDDVDDCLETVTRRRIRHLPVCKDGRLVGLVSSGDLVKHKLLEQRYEIDQMVGYIGGYQVDNDTPEWATAAALFRSAPH